MMPFSVLRTWGTGLLGWALLVAAAYCFYEWRQRRAPRPVIDDIDATIVERDTLDQPRVSLVPNPNQDRAWPWLAAALGLLAFSFGGFIPVSLLAGKPSFSRPRRTDDVERKGITRPDGTRLHVEISGKRDAPVLVFTHGWSLDGSAWYYLQRALANRFRVVTWDLPGLGYSTGPKDRDFSLEKMAGDLNAVVQECGEGAVILIGHSIGGMINQTFCRLFRMQLGSTVRGVVLLQTTYTNPLNTALAAAFWKAIEKPILVPLNHLTVWVAPLAWLSNWQGYLNGSLHLMTRLASFSGRQTWGQLDYGAWLAAKAWPGTVARGNLAMLEFDEQKTLAEIQVPCLVISGVHDRMTTPEASVRIEELVSHALPVSLKAGHLGLWEAHSQLSDVIAEFAVRMSGEDRKQGKGLSSERAQVTSKVGL
jgi:pimeloyl-ACP methyl ester carboxylesterase